MASRVDLRLKPGKRVVTSPAAYLLGGGASDFGHTASLGVPSAPSHGSQEVAPLPMERDFRCNAK